MITIFGFKVIAEYVWRGMEQELRDTQEAVKQWEGLYWQLRTQIAKPVLLEGTFEGEEQKSDTRLLQLKQEFAESVRNAQDNEAELRKSVEYWRQKALQYKHR